VGSGYCGQCRDTCCRATRTLMFGTFKADISRISHLLAVIDDNTKKTT
jgi:hypothetical protein